MLNIDFKNMNTVLIKKAIIKTIAFFDMFDYPMTDLEVWRNIGVKSELSDIKDSLADSSKIINQKDGFYFLQGRGEIVKTRMLRHDFANRKFRRALMVAKIFKFIPWIKMIAVSNIIGSYNLKDNSDIDLFIITENKKIWITRFFCAGLMKLLRLRPKNGNTRDKICLNFYVSENAMNFKNIMIYDDIYFIYWMTGLVPIYDKEEVYKKFVQANDWIKKCLPNWQSKEMVGKYNAGKNFSIIYYKIIDILLGRFEKIFKIIQLKLMPKDLKDLMNKDTRVVINDNILKLHVNDNRKEYRFRYELKVCQPDASAGGRVKNYEN